MAKKALIVDDDPRVMKIIEETLQGLNHEHVWVTNQHDARRALDIEQFDYVLLELRIPAKPRRGGASSTYGLELLREIISDPHCRGLPVIMTTTGAADSIKMSIRLRSYGAADSIAKPFWTSGRSLAHVIQATLGFGATGPADLRAPVSHAT